MEFFSNHPNPDNRLERVDQEINLLGGSPRSSKTDSREFQDIKRYVLSLPAPPAIGGTQSLTGNTGSGDSGQRSTTGLRILSASYGAKDRFNDVRQRLQSRVQNDRLNLQVTNASMGGDPIGDSRRRFVSAMNGLAEPTMQLCLRISGLPSPPNNSRREPPHRAAQNPSGHQTVSGRSRTPS